MRWDGDAHPTRDVRGAPPGCFGEQGSGVLQGEAMVPQTPHGLRATAGGEGTFIGVPLPPDQPHPAPGGGASLRPPHPLISIPPLHPTASPVPSVISVIAPPGPGAPPRIHRGRRTARSAPPERAVGGLRSPGVRRGLGLRAVHCAVLGGTGQEAQGHWEAVGVPRGVLGRSSVARRREARQDRAEGPERTRGGVGQA